MPQPSPSLIPDRVARERDLYRRLLEIARHEEPDPLLTDALGLVTDVTGAEQGYLEMTDEHGRPSWWTAVGLSESEIAGAKRRISRSIIADAIASGETVCVPSALLDESYGSTDSVRTASIGAVCCAPIGHPPQGVLYIQQDAARGWFDEETRRLVQLVCEHLAPALDRVLERRRATGASDPTAALRARLQLDGVVGRSPLLAEILKLMRLAAPLDVTVLLTGESGTGKTQLARAIHANGPRSTGPFVDLNCATLPDELVESELFGALPGAHSTATRRIPGKVEAAEGGTLFLDEIGDLSGSAQAKLLQLLHAKEYYPLGATAPVRANVRIIAATNTDLAAAVAAHNFREDLYYRLTVLQLRMPSLRERSEDIPLLVEHFAARASSANSLPVVRFSPHAMAALRAAEWPGNVRQLANCVLSAVIRAAGEKAAQVERRHLFPEEKGQAETTVTFQEATRQFQADFLRRALEEADWNVSEVARRLDLARSHVYNLIHAFGLRRGT